jgi:hypothetical protein
MRKLERPNRRDRGSKRTAMTMQHILMYGLSRSPILAHFQNMPINLPYQSGVCFSLSAELLSKKKTYPSLLLSIILGNNWCTYAQVQMSRRMTSRRDWKLKRADCDAHKLRTLLCGDKTMEGNPYHVGYLALPSLERLTEIWVDVAVCGVVGRQAEL